MVIDYVQLIDGPNKVYRDEELSKIILDLKEMARTLDGPVILMSQSSRQAEFRVNNAQC